MDHQSSTTPHALILGLTLEQAISVLAKKPVDATHYNYLEDDEYNTYVMMKPEWTSLNKTKRYWLLLNLKKNNRRYIP